MKFTRRTAFAIPLGILFILFLSWKILIFLQKPNYDGKVALRGIGSEVTVIRDEYGVPHIKAEDEHSAYFALGYVMAQDRIFQMEILRRLSQGRLAEIIGEDLVPVDQMFRSLRLGKWAKEYASKKEKLAPQAWKNLDSYLAGVNSFIAEGNLPIEYTLMGIPTTPFQREDALSTLAYMGFSFAEGIRSDSLFTILQEKFPNSRIQDLFPRYDYEEGGSILNDQPTSPKLSVYTPNNKREIPSLKKDQMVQMEHKDFSFHQNVSSSDTQRNVSVFLKGLDRYLGDLPIFEGSNSWVLSGSRTESGLPLLVNDPHIGYSNPGTWMEIHLTHPGIDIYGYYLAGVPYPLLGNTKEMGWGLTMLENDDMDLYFETISDDDTQVIHKGKWIDLVTWDEEILVKGGKKENYTVKMTPRGPVFSDFIAEYEGDPISLYWVFHEEENPLLDVLHNMLHSQSIKEMRDSASKIVAPGLNISYANQSGDIAWWGVGRFPIRKKIVNQRKILNGSKDENDVIAFLPFNRNPQIENPKNGIIATANNLPSRNSYPNLGRLEGYWQPSDRFNRITEVLSKKDKFNVEDMKNLLLDNESYSASKIWDIYVHNFDWESEFWKNQKRLDLDLSKTAIELLSNWNFNTDLDSRGATVYYVLTYFAMKNMLEDEMGEEQFKIYGTTADSITSFKYLIQIPDHPLWNNVGTKDRIENRKNVLDQSLVDTVHFLINRVSSSPNLWSWGNLYHVEYVHAIGRKKPFDRIFNLGPYRTWGAPEVVNNVKARLNYGDFSAQSGPSTRRVLSFSNPDENLTVLPTGNSGNLASPYYDNQVNMYLKGMFRNTNFSKDAIQKAQKHQLILVEP